MTTSRGITLRLPFVIIGGVILIAGGALGANWLRRPPALSPTTSTASSPPPAVTAPQVQSGDIEIRLSPAVQANAKFETAAITRISVASELQVPGVVAANAYNQTIVTSLVGGRMSTVAAQLGQQVRRGEVLAEIYSPELAEAETMLVSMQADFESAHKELLRTERLVAIGSASQQELEKVRAEHTRHAAGVESARAKLRLFGVSADALAALERSGVVQPIIRVTAPRAGEITSRTVNDGANVAGGAELFTITDLSTVWVVGSVYETDLSRVRVGDSATISAPGLPGVSLDGRVSYLDPQLSPETRTAQVRIELPNRQNQLRLGMFVAVVIGSTPTAPVLAVPAAAVQTVASRQFVYLVGSEPHQYLEREVIAAPAHQGLVSITGGLADGDRVVTTGSFLLRSERERLGLRPADDKAKPPADASGKKPQSFAIAVTADGFSPARIEAPPNVPVALTFTRTADQTCATEVAVPSLKIKKALPLNTPVTLTFTPDRTGTVDFVCGMNMLKGSVVVK